MQNTSPVCGLLAVVIRVQIARNYFVLKQMHSEFAQVIILFHMVRPIIFHLSGPTIALTSSSSRYRASSHRPLLHQSSARTENTASTSSSRNAAHHHAHRPTSHQFSARIDHRLNINIVSQHSLFNDAQPLLIARSRRQALDLRLSRPTLVEYNHGRRRFDGF